MREEGADEAMHQPLEGFHSQIYHSQLRRRALINKPSASVCLAFLVYLPIVHFSPPSPKKRKKKKHNQHLHLRKKAVEAVVTVDIVLLRRGPFILFI